MNTEKLYYQDSHIFEFEAQVLDCREHKGGYCLILDRTAFFPEGGGQLADTGYIGDIRINDVHEKQGEILHYCASPLAPGSYHCRIDREQRLCRMQNHSGEHVVSGIAHNLYGCENVGFHMGEGSMTIDFDKELGWDELMEIELRANQAVRANLPVRTSFPDSAALSTLQYRSKLELTENVRIVEIEGVDRCACCAPHVKSTGEIGCIKILDSERHRGGIRLSLACGMDALRDYRCKQDNISAISQALSAKRHESSRAVERLLSEQQQAKERIAQLSMELAVLKAASIAPTEGNICVFDHVLDEVALRELVNLLMEKCGGMAAAFSGSEEDGYRYIIGSLHIDLRASAKQINSLINGRGGGTSQMIQGRSSASRGEIEKAISTWQSIAL